MLPAFKSFAVNWVDGMKINKDHFEQTDAYTKELVRDAIALQLNDFNYGLCLPVEEGGTALNVKINVDPAKIIRVHLISCRAITQGGSRIEFGLNPSLKINAETEKLTAEFGFEDSKEKNFYVLLSVNIHAKVVSGQPDADEIPPRYPYISPEYSLQVLPESQINLFQVPANAIIVGCLQYQAGKMKVMDNYIPPCTTVKSFSLLLDTYFKLGNLLGETGKNIAVVVDKIHSKSQTTSLVKSCLTLCNQVADFISGDLGSYRWMRASQPPVFMLDCFLRLAYKISVTLSNLPVKDKEELINYICEWMEESPAGVNEKINRLIKTEYQHNNIADTVDAVDEFMQLVHAMFSKLAQLDFIGKKKGERAFVQEKTANEPEPPLVEKKKSGWSFMAD